MIAQAGEAADGLDTTEMHALDAMLQSASAHQQRGVSPTTRAANAEAMAGVFPHSYLADCPRWGVYQIVF